ncbi:hypothetical protein GQ600_13309 [Phytophthora cactorum]|nr:hypothetical protein GQ600_13309 [Phytophthora cactorum]
MEEEMKHVGDVKDAADLNNADKAKMVDEMQIVVKGYVFYIRSRLVAFSQSSWRCNRRNTSPALNSTSVVAIMETHQHSSTSIVNGADMSGNTHASASAIVIVPSEEQILDGDRCDTTTQTQPTTHAHYTERRSDGISIEQNKRRGICGYTQSDASHYSPPPEGVHPSEAEAESAWTLIHSFNVTKKELERMWKVILCTDVSLVIGGEAYNHTELTRRRARSARSTVNSTGCPMRIKTVAVDGTPPRKDRGKSNIPGTQVTFVAIQDLTILACMIRICKGKLNALKLQVL